MTFCVELGAFDPDGEVVGAMPEDIVLVTEDGIDNLTRYMPLDLWIAK
jgi:Xaa-Pro aminopeptidase